METMGLLMRCKSYFGLRPGTGLADFKKEMTDLTPKDRQDLVLYFNEAGLPTEDRNSKVAA